MSKQIANDYDIIDITSNSVGCTSFRGFFRSSEPVVQISDSSESPKVTKTIRKRKAAPKKAKPTETATNALTSFAGSMDVAILGNALRWRSLDAKTISLDETHLEPSEKMSDFSAMLMVEFTGSIVGSQVDDLSELVNSFLAQLEAQEANKAAVLATHIYVLGSHGNMRVCKEIPLEAALIEMCPFLDQEDIVTPIGLLWICLHRTSQEVPSDTLTQDVANYYASSKGDSEKSMLAIFKIIAAICTFFAGGRCMTPEKHMEVGDIIAEIGVIYKIPNPHFEIKKIEEMFYANHMTKFHPKATDKDEESLGLLEYRPFGPKQPVIEVPQDDTDTECQKRKGEEQQPTRITKKKKSDVPPLPEGWKNGIVLSQGKKGGKTVRVVANFVVKGPYKTIEPLKKMTALLDATNIEILIPGQEVLKPIGYLMDPESGDYYAKFRLISGTPRDTWKIENGVCVRKSMGFQTVAEYIKADKKAFMESNMFSTIFGVYMWFCPMHFGKRTLSNVFVLNGKLFFTGFGAGTKDPIVAGSEPHNFVLSIHPNKVTEKIFQDLFETESDTIQGYLADMKNLADFGVFEADDDEENAEAKAKIRTAVEQCPKLGLPRFEDVFNKITGVLLKKLV